MIPRSLLMDPDAPPDAKLVYAALSAHVGSAREAWPKQATMAHYLGISERQVRRSLSWLRERGYATWETRIVGGMRSVNVYTLPVSSDPQISDRPHSPVPNLGPATLAGPKSRTGHTVRPDRPHSPVRNENQLREFKTLRSIDELFAEWYAAYPRHAGRQAARRSFERDLKKVGFEVLLAGAQRYRDDPNREAQYTKHPAPWLNQGCWDDDPLPARAGSMRTAPAQPAPPRSISTPYAEWKAEQDKLAETPGPWEKAQ